MHLWKLDLVSIDERKLYQMVWTFAEETGRCMVRNEEIIVQERLVKWIDKILN